MHATIAEHSVWMIEERLTDHARKAKLDDVGKKLAKLLPEYQAQLMDRDEFLDRVAELTKEQEELTAGPARPAGPRCRDGSPEPTFT
jgi:hypothetical protein